MIVKRRLSLRRVIEYTAGPIAWAVVWAVAVPIAYALLDDPDVFVPFPVVTTLGAALAIFVAFRNNSAFARWNDARAAWQSVLVAARTRTRQVVASTRDAESAGIVSESRAAAYRQAVAEHLVAFAWSLAEATRSARPIPRAGTGAKTPGAALVELAVRVKEGVRTGVLGQFDPISTEPQFVALNAAQGNIERIASTPTLRQYAYFTRRLVVRARRCRARRAVARHTTGAPAHRHVRRARGHGRGQRRTVRESRDRRSGRSRLRAARARRAGDDRPHRSTAAPAARRRLPVVTDHDRESVKSEPSHALTVPSSRRRCR